MGNTLGISRKYLRFFVNNIDSRHIVVQGGRRSAKSFSVYKWVRFLASGKPKRVLVVTATYPALQLAIDDFQRATGLIVSGNTLLGFSCRMGNGSVWQFRAFDNYTKAQGTTADICIVEEALNIDSEIIATLMMSVTEKVFFVYNPTKNSYIDRYILPDKSNHIITTYLDNPYLTESQIQEFEDMKRRAQSPTASIIDQYQWRVYGLGDFSTLGGKVFPVVYTCTDEDYRTIDAKECFCIDFGFQESRDQTAMAGVKIYNNCLYAKEYIYDNVDCQKDINLARRLRDLGINEYTPLLCDYGGNGRARIHNLVTACDGEWTEEGVRNGFYCFNVNKGSSILEGLKKMTNMDKIIVTEGSVNLRDELARYELKPDGKPVEKYADHLIACCRYGVQSYHLV